MKMLESSEREHFQNTKKFFLSTLDFDEIKPSVKHMGADSFLNYLNLKLNTNRHEPLNVAVIGPDRCGKESLIRAWLKMKPHEEILMNVHKGRNCVGYSVQEFNIIMWKLPSLSFQDPQYLKDIGFSSFDFLLLLGCNRFLEIHSWLASLAVHQGKKFFYVKTKIDEDLRNEERSHPKTFNEEAVLSKSRCDIIQGLKHSLGNSLFEECIFIISNDSPDKWDFPLLFDHFSKNYSKIKQCSMQLSPLVNFFVTEKKTILKRNLMWMPILSALVSFAFPVPFLSIFVDWLLVKKCISDGKNFYGNLFLMEYGTDLSALNEFKFHWTAAAGQAAQIIRICLLLTIEFKYTILPLHLVMGFIPGVLSFWHLRNLVGKKVEVLSNKLYAACREWLKIKISNFYS